MQIRIDGRELICLMLTDVSPDADVWAVPLQSDDMAGLATLYSLHYMSPEGVLLGYFISTKEPFKLTPGSCLICKSSFVRHSVKSLVRSKGGSLKEFLRIDGVNVFKYSKDALLFTSLSDEQQNLLEVIQ